MGRKRRVIAQGETRGQGCTPAYKDKYITFGSTGTFAKRLVGLQIHYPHVDAWFWFVLFYDLLYIFFKKRSKLYCISVHSNRINFNRSRNLRHLCWSALHLGMSIDLSNLLSLLWHMAAEESFVTCRVTQNSPPVFYQTPNNSLFYSVEPCNTQVCLVPHNSQRKSKAMRFCSSYRIGVLASQLSENKTKTHVVTGAPFQPSFNSNTSSQPTFLDFCIESYCGSP